MSAIKNPRPARTLTRAERFAALAAERPAAAPAFKIGDVVTVDGREGRVEDFKRMSSGFVYTVATLGGSIMVGESALA